jgi:phage terminase large subunit-like protein
VARDKRPAELPQRNAAEMSLGEFIEFASGTELSAPEHLGRYFELMAHLDGGNLRECVSMPPQHGKSTTCHYAIAWTLHRNPGLMFAYGSYAKEFANDQSAKIRDIYMQTGGAMKSDHNRKENWRTDMGGGLIACSPDSGLTGYRIDVFIGDDLVRDAESISDERMRTKVWNWLHGVVFQRLWVETSVVVIGTRWHPDDPIGRLIAKGFHEINMAAVSTDDNGDERALWPTVKPLEWLNTKRYPYFIGGELGTKEHAALSKSVEVTPNPDFVGEHEWATQYQGKPQPREGSLFGKPTYYDELPANAQPCSIGIDIGYDSTTASDWSGYLVLAWDGEYFYVHEVKRVRAPIIEDTLREAQAEYPGVRMCIYTSGPEKGTLNIMFNNGIAVERMPAKWNKWTRAKNTAKAWKTGRIKVRRGQPWTAAFCLEVEFFTGEEHGVDDQVDMLVSAHDLIMLNAPVGWVQGGFSFGKAVM